nr:reverse transcriptase family protein [Escherichia coli]
MLEMGVIEESNSAWCSPIVLVAKKDGTVRFCVDYRKVNDVSRFDAYPMPRVDELLDRLGTARFFTTLDLTKGYWQIPLSPESKEKTAFSTPYGLYQFTMLPFGLLVPRPRSSASWTGCCARTPHMRPHTWMM